MSWLSAHWMATEVEIKEFVGTILGRRFCAQSNEKIDNALEIFLMFHHWCVTRIPLRLPSFSRQAQARGARMRVDRLCFTLVRMKSIRFKAQSADAGSSSSEVEPRMGRTFKKRYSTDGVESSFAIAMLMAANLSLCSSIHAEPLVNDTLTAISPVFVGPSDDGLAATLGHQLRLDTG